jgi:translation initiation factor 1
MTTIEIFMPFTIGGDWVQESSPSENKKPVKVLKEKRRSSYVTIILYLPQEDAQLKKLCSTLKQRLGCGGSVKEGRIELQGDQVNLVKAYLKEMGH